MKLEAYHNAVVEQFDVMRGNELVTRIELVAGYDRTRGYMVRVETSFCSGKWEYATGGAAMRIKGRSAALKAGLAFAEQQLAKFVEAA